MICRALRNIILSVSVAAGLIACVQQSGAAVSGVTLANSTLIAAHGHKKSASHRRSRASATGLSLTATAAAPAVNYQQLAGTGGSLWDRLRTNFQLANAANRPQVQAQINWFMHNQSYLNRTIRRAVPYMYLIFQETQARNLPAELVLLPIMESAYNPFIRSSRGAVGLWQLMSGTASGFGVRQDFWYDGRRDVYASTNAALDYLTYLQSYFGGDWLLAIAAYDAGEGRLQNAVRHNAERGLSTDFWSLSLPLETQAYVPRLLALAAIIQNPGKYNLTLPPITDQPYLQQVDLGAPINLAKAAEMAGMSLAQLKTLNPGYSRTVTGPNGPYRLLLPIDRITLFKERLAGTFTAATATSPANYAGKTALQTTDVTVTQPSAMAPQTTAPDDASPHNDINAATGDSNAMTRTEGDTNSATMIAATKVAAQRKSITHQNYYVVKSGETLSEIAQRFNLTVSTLSRWNDLKSSHIKPGMRLAITSANDVAKENYQAAQNEPARKANHAAKRLSRFHYTVRNGDNLRKIAARYNVTRAHLYRWNHLTEHAVVKPGQKLIIYRNNA